MSWALSVVLLAAAVFAYVRLPFLHRRSCGWRRGRS